MIIKGKKDQIEEYFNSKRISQSTLKAVVFGGKQVDSDLYYKENLNFLRGSLVDNMLSLSKEEFDSIYYISTLDKKPSDTIMSIIKEYYDTHGDKPGINKQELLEIIRRVGYNNRMSDDKIVAKVISESEGYYNELLLAEDKQVVSLEEINSANILVDKLKQSEALSKIFGGDEDTIVIYQVPIYFDYKNIEGKALLDGIFINKKTKEWFIFDIKTMSSPIIKFIDNFKRFRYDFQIAYYQNAVNIVSLKEILKQYNIDIPDIDKYTILPPRFMVGSFDEKSKANEFIFNNWVDTLHKNIGVGDIVYTCVDAVIDQFKTIQDNDGYDVLSNEESLNISLTGVTNKEFKPITYGNQH